MPEQRYVTFEGKTHAFPPDFTDAEISAALGAIPASNQAAAPKAKSWTNWLPAVGGAIGGLVGGVPGAAMGGAAGKGYQQLIDHAAELPGAIVDVAKAAVEHPIDTQVEFYKGQGQGYVDAASQAAQQAGMQLAGAGMAAGMKGAATPLMRGALGRSSLTLAQKPDVAKVALQTGTNVTRSSIAALDDTIARTSGLADKAALETTRKAVEQAWKNADLTQVAKRGGILSTLLIASAKNPAILSAMANGLYHSAGYMAHIAPNALRAAVLALDSEQSEKE